MNFHFFCSKFPEHRLFEWKNTKHLQAVSVSAGNGPTLPRSRPKVPEALDRGIQECSVGLEQITLSIGRVVGTLQSEY